MHQEKNFRSFWKSSLHNHAFSLESHTITLPLITSSYNVAQESSHVVLGDLALLWAPVEGAGLGPLQSTLLAICCSGHIQSWVIPPFW